MAIPNNGIPKHLGQGNRKKRCPRIKSGQLVEEVAHLSVTQETDLEAQFWTGAPQETVSRTASPMLMFRQSLAVHPRFMHVIIRHMVRVSLNV